MDKASKIKALLAGFGTGPNNPIQGTVTAVDGQTCTVKIASGLELSDVRLNATVTDSENFLLLTPAVGSDVTLLSVDGTLRNLIVIKVDELQKFEFAQSGLTILFDGTDKKVQIENEDCGLKEIFEDLATLLRELKVFTPNGPSGTPLPTTMTAIQNLELKFNKLLK